MKSVIVAVCVLVLGGVASSMTATKKAPGKKNPVAIVQTNMGTFECVLYANDAPKTVANFVGLSKKKFYNGIRFHRVVKGFVIQAGDPNSKDLSKQAQWGTGGESIYGKEFEDELNPNTESYKKGYAPGVLAMANRGPNTNTSQFFVMCGSSLPHQYTIFGAVTKGMEVIRKIEAVPVAPGDRTKTDVIIKSITIK